MSNTKAIPKLNIKMSKPVRDTVIIILTGLAAFVLSTFLHLYEGIVDYIQANRIFGIGNIFFSLIVVSIALVVFSWRRWQELNNEISERIKAQRKLNESKTQLQAVLDGVPDMIMQVDKDLRILWANKEVLKRNPDAKFRPAFLALSYDKGTFIDSTCKWAIELGKIEKNITYQPDMVGIDGVSYWETIGVPIEDKEKRVYGAIAIARDITSRMRLEHTWNLLSSIVESTDDAIFGVSWEGIVLSWNKGAEKTYGFTQSEIIGKPVSILEPIELRDEIIFYIDKVMRTNDISRIETERIKKGGKKIIVSSTICPFVDATGRKIGISSIDRDITESKIAEEALRESELFNKTIISSVDEGIIVFDNELKYIVWNEFMEEITGTMAEEVIGAGAAEKFPDMIETGIMGKLRTALKGEPVKSVDTRYQNRVTGKMGWISNSYSPHISARGEIIGVVVIIRDITDRKESEQALVQSELRFKELFDHMSSGVYIFEALEEGMDFILTNFNKGGENIEVITKEEIVGMKASEIFMKLKIKSLLDVLIKVHITNEPEHYMLTIQKENGELNWRDTYIYKLPSGEVVAIYDDVTERKEAEYELKVSREQMRRLANHLESAREEERKKIAFEIHDELGYALTAIKMDISWLSKKMADYDEVYLQRIKSMSELTETTLNKVRSISTQLRPSVLDHFGIAAAIDWAAKEFQKRTAVRCKVIIYPEDIRLDENVSIAVFRIFQEALTNITRHANASRVDVSFTNNDGIIELQVKDNGKGIAKKQIDALKSLGLVGMREKAKSHGGTLDVSGRKGFGTTVTLTIPINQKEPVND